MVLLLIAGEVVSDPLDSSGAAGPHLHAGAVPYGSAGAAGSHIHNAVLPAAAVEAVPIPLPRTGWTASASDEEVNRMNGRASNVLDGNAATMWHSRWSPAPAAPLPHTITIDTKATRGISGLRYLPRADGTNGRVGKYSIGVSTNGITWSVVASGTWPDTSTEKTVNFTAVSARYVRLTATTEAGNRGPWSSAAEINLLGPSVGSWGPTISFPIVPAAVALLPGNRLLTWSAYSPTAFGGSRGYTQTSIMDLATGKVTPAQVVNTGHDMFCSGTSLLADGKIMISGGSCFGSRAGFSCPVPRSRHSSQG